MSSPRESHFLQGTVIIQASSTNARRPLPSFSLIISCVLLLLITIVILGQGFKDFALNWSNLEASQQQCQTLRLRKEWRALSTKEQQSYIKAFQCFSTLPNPYGSNGSLYDEFSRVHRSIGSFCRSRLPKCQNLRLTINHFKHTSQHLSSLGIGTSYIYTRRP